MSDRRLILAYFPSWGGTHRAAWRLPETPIDPAQLFATHRRWAQICERAKLHMYFIADRVAIVGGEDMTIASTMPEHLTLEPSTMISALSQHTEQIGLLITSATTYDHPYHVARRLATADHLSGGRLAWNVVAGGAVDDAPNFGLEPVPHDTRYERAEEFVDAVRGLWDSFDDDAFVLDREGNRFYDPDKVHVLGLRGEFVSSRGPLNVARPPQGHPVIAQAGASGPGKALAARVGDVVFGMPLTIAAAREFRTTLKEMAAGNGRDPEQVKYLPDLTILLGRTRDEVDARLAQLDGLVDIDRLLPDLSRFLAVDLSQHPLDGPVPEPEKTAGGQTVQAVLLQRAHEEDLSIRQLVQHFARTVGLFHAGTPQSLADFMQEWQEAGAADGFVVRIADPEPSLTYFAELVVPELQRRGLFRSNYEGATLRENLGLSRPSAAPSHA
ncbi:MAG TPA: NtaA/DmoA family FMN-dependent monooxygenase [Baekduia sp.]|uniref:NtaA/DmoA family FMN-dependent monooxygenase n=1 Tax=Baekduia sp. TaxID=2600305 RepID=UPI002D785656|nr:NtaA/DmoA family FMN-dependent monooxygenase [Baekduia sp.]HET6509001.1 NtaA/DmoA family FMN-dependent monooxygenase [Baekduia sp.]